MTKEHEAAMSDTNGTKIQKLVLKSHESVLIMQLNWTARVKSILWMRISNHTYMKISLNNHIEKTLPSPIKGRWSRQQYVEKDSTAPRIHRLPIRLSLNDLRRHEVWCADTTCNIQTNRRVKIWSQQKLKWIL